ncbi:MAG: glycosyltransferase [Candidatus Cloacimonetes bacterium]|jgi:cellulose synthase/poly-beta-1,6-N-acetylglucosamine synthase-like glycosyltransferase|nr:glycosyltransferase [Candidatus Cloacimonadota bacterium]MBT6994595.1 glycosyltransferase [Candidatus Cloacimonadota bacterium]MBT7470272.1 glycosyltransferase [Candidatus Cloacimonadota bacterium]
MPIILIFTTIFFGIYLYYLLFFKKNLKYKNREDNFQKPKISVVIAARNEANNVGKLLTALVNQSYPQNLMEIIVANDESTDNTAEIVKKFEQKWQNVKLLNVTNRANVISPKKNALSQAIKFANGEIILSTDADCLVGKFWAEAMVKNFSQNDFVAGFSRINIQKWTTARWFEKFEYFDFFAMFTAASAAISGGKAFSCSGQNIAYRKNAFQKIGGFEKIKHLISGDDVNLMQLFRKANFRIGFAFSHHSFALTNASKSWIKLLNQRSRWASNMKWQILLNSEFFIYLLSAFVVVMLPVYLIFKIWWLASILVLGRFILEFNFLKNGFQIFREDKNRLKFYPVWFFLQPLYMLVVVFLGVLNIFRWKK